MSLLNQQFENHLFALCNGLASLKYEERDSMFYRGRFTGWLFVLDAPQEASRVSAWEREFYGELRRLADEHLVYGMNLALIALPSGELAAVAAWDPEKGQTGKEQVSRFFESVEAAADNRCGPDMMMTVLKTDECTGFEAMNGQLEQLMRWTELRAICGIGSRLECARLAMEAESADKLEAGRLLAEIADHFQSRMYLQYQKAVGSLEELLQRTRIFENPVIRKAHRQFIRYTLGIEVHGDAPVQQTIEQLRKLGEDALRESREPAPANLIDQVIRCIEQHYMDDIGIGQIAAELNVSANYLSTLFHKKTGCTFVKYLTKIRMLKAKELLVGTNLQIKQIAEQVGYYSTRHFTKLFTEMFGRYPSDFRNTKGSFQNEAKIDG
jgi:two-component system response regulator YesN